MILSITVVGKTERQNCLDNDITEPMLLMMNSVLHHSKLTKSFVVTPGLSSRALVGDIVLCSWVRYLIPTVPL